MDSDDPIAEILIGAAVMDAAEEHLLVLFGLLQASEAQRASGVTSSARKRPAFGSVPSIT